MYTHNQKAKIHIAKKALGLDEDDYRAFLYGLTGKYSSAKMNTGELALVLAAMTKRGAFKSKQPLTGQQKACVAKWYHLRRLGAVNSKDKSSLNRFIKKHLNGWHIAELDAEKTNKLLGMLEGWIVKVEKKDNSARATKNGVIHD